MPYFIIEKQPVFMTNKKYKKIRQEALKDKDASFRIGSRIQYSYYKNKEKEEAEKLMYNTLKNKYDENQEIFFSDWVSFDLIGKDAQENIWDLLYDYCNYYGHSYLSDPRSEISKIVDEFVGDSLLYPMGKVFLLNHLVKPHKWYWKYIFKMRNRHIKILISVDKVSRITGNLTQFKIALDNGTILNCGRDILILS